MYKRSLSLTSLLLLITLFFEHVSAQSQCQTLTKSSASYTTVQKKRQYQLTCETDMVGSDLASQTVGNFTACMAACDTVTNCVAVVYGQGNNVCYMKSVYARDINTTPKGGYDFAKLSTLTKATVSKAVDGSWGAQINFPIVPVAAAVIPITGRLLVWSAARKDLWTSNDANAKYTLSAEYNPQTGSVSSRNTSNTGHDMFCPGISLDATGKLVVTGGSTDNVTSVFDPFAYVWKRGGDLQVPRGYQSTATLSNGKIFMIGGSWNGGLGGKIGELWDPATSKWTKMPGCPADPILTADQEGIFRSDNHAWLFAWKDGSVFHAGPSKAMHWFGTSGTGSVTNAGSRTDGQDAMCGPAVMYDVGKIMAAGGAPSYTRSQALKSAHVITLGNPGAQPAVQQLANMSYARAFSNSVVLPNGEVLITGGQTYAETFTDNNPTQYPELWSPKTNKFRVLESKEPMARTYHSVGILMPDGTVFSGGGGLCGDDACNHYEGRIFTPPYLFKGENLAARPVISALSATAFRAGATFNVTLQRQTTATPTFAILRMGSTTHTVNTDQRRVPLTPISSSGSNYTLQLPSDYGVLLPGYWYLFAMENDVPSISKSLQIRL